MLNVFKGFRTCNNSAGSSGALGSEAGNNFSKIVFQTPSFQLYVTKINFSHLFYIWLHFKNIFLIILNVIAKIITVNKFWIRS